MGMIVRAFMILKADIVNVVDDRSFCSTVYNPQESVVDYTDDFLSLCKLHNPFSSNHTAYTYFITICAKIHKHKSVKILYSEHLKTNLSTV